MVGMVLADSGRDGASRAGTGQPVGAAGSRPPAATLISVQAGHELGNAVMAGQDRRAATFKALANGSVVG
jgi:hypothetical protein